MLIHIVKTDAMERKAAYAYINAVPPLAFPLFYLVMEKKTG